MKSFKEFNRQALIKKLKKVKGITKDQMTTLSTMNATVLQTVINQLSTLVMGGKLDERSALVADIPNVIKIMLKDVQAKLEKELKQGKSELANNIGRLVGLRITTKGQQKNRAFMYNLEKGFRAKKPGSRGGA